MPMSSELLVYGCAVALTPTASIRCSCQCAFCVQCARVCVCSGRIGRACSKAALCRCVCIILFGVLSLRFFVPTLHCIWALWALHSQPKCVRVALYWCNEHIKIWERFKWSKCMDALSKTHLSCPKHSLYRDMRSTYIQRNELDSRMRANKREWTVFHTVLSLIFEFVLFSVVVVVVDYGCVWCIPKWYVCAYAHFVIFDFIMRRRINISKRKRITEWNKYKKGGKRRRRRIRRNFEFSLQMRIFTLQASQNAQTNEWKNRISFSLSK